MNDFAGRRVTVMGLGRFGGGAGVTRWLIQRGARVLLTDLDPRDKLADSLASIDDLARSGALGLRLGGHDERDFRDTDLVVANPAVPRPWSNAYLRAARQAGVPVTTEIRLLVERLPERRRVIAITGTVGKSTTSALIAHGLRAAGSDVFFGGNIGGSLLPELARITPSSDVVLEVSSAMLHWLARGAGFDAAPGWSPGVAVVTNIAPNHLDWHETFDHYRDCKLQLLRDQAPTDRAVVHESVADWASLTAAKVHIVRNSDAQRVPPLAIPGRHNRQNAAVAIAALASAGLDEQDAGRAVATFPGLPDRLQALGWFELPGGRGRIRAFNDSKSTTPEAALLAVEAMDDEPHVGAGRVRLICGGYDKKVSLAELARAAARCAGAYTVGATGAGLAQEISRLGGKAYHCGDVSSAVDRAIEHAVHSDVILLSPGCASWDQFTNYEERGRVFARAVGRLTAC
ncbi:MAG: UDP-N-acetylmuramoyl-L-alanine--D-glutamate ligase [Planctomycetota bacterium]|nr:UDP-N-acetylmuramoyl-L-alanine--D-glutamate ligase [Planctomycetota bacterium]